MKDERRCAWKWVILIVCGIRRGARLIKVRDDTFVKIPHPIRNERLAGILIKFLHPVVTILSSPSLGKVSRVPSPFHSLCPSWGNYSNHIDNKRNKRKLELKMNVSSSDERQGLNTLERPQMHCKTDVIRTFYLLVANVDLTYCNLFLQYMLSREVLVQTAFPCRLMLMLFIEKQLFKMTLSSQF